MTRPDRDEFFVEMLKRSGLIESRRLNEALADFKVTPESAGNTPLIARTLIERGLLTEWQHQNLRQGRINGLIVGRYKLLDIVAGGGMGTVYLAEHLLMKRRVALKVLRPALGAEQVNVERFYREARAAAMLDHPNIVAVHDVGSEGDFHFLAMEYLQGLTLRDLVVQRGLPPFGQAADYIRQAAEALAYAHGLQIVHRDIKPENFFVLADGTLKVLDLGLARISHAGEEMLTMTDNLLGTVDYMSPEQAQDSHDVGPATDIYSLGCTLYFVLTGHPPFPNGTAAQRLVFHLMKAPPSIYQERPTAPCGLVSICEQMMAKDPADRYPSALALLEALNAWRDEWRATQGEEKYNHAAPLAGVKLTTGSQKINLMDASGENGPSATVVKGPGGSPAAPSTAPAPAPSTAKSAVKEPAPASTPAPQVAASTPASSESSSPARPVTAPLPESLRTDTAAPGTPLGFKVSLARLLGHRDGTLPAELASQMTNAIQHPAVIQLLDRIERAVVRSWSNVDGNLAEALIVSGWLDGTLDKESRRSFEQMSIASEEQLAELAMVHRIQASAPPMQATLVPGPTTPEEQARLARMYKLGAGK